jgi:hypothetical protein
MLLIESKNALKNLAKLIVNALFARQHFLADMSIGFKSSSTKNCKVEIMRKNPIEKRKSHKSSLSSTIIYSSLLADY